MLTGRRVNLLCRTFCLYLRVCPKSNTIVVNPRVDNSDPNHENVKRQGLYSDVDRYGW